MALGCRDGAPRLPVPCGGKRWRSQGVPARSAGGAPPAASSHRAVPESWGLWGTPLPAPSPAPRALPLFRGAGKTAAGGCRGRGGWTPWRGDTAPSSGTLVGRREAAVPGQKRAGAGPPCAPHAAPLPAPARGDPAAPRLFGENPRTPHPGAGKSLPGIPARCGAARCGRVGAAGALPPGHVAAVAGRAAPGSLPGPSLPAPTNTTRHKYFPTLQRKQGGERRRSERAGP